MKARHPSSAEHIIIYRDERYFSGWPFNGGFWQFADGELAVGFVRGKTDYSDRKNLRHEYVDCEQGEHVILRSTDGGFSWPEEEMATVYTRPAWDEITRKMDCTGHRPGKKYDPAADGYCLISGYGIPTPGAEEVAFTTVSTDRGRTWSKPSRIPNAGCFLHLGGRPSYVIREDGLLLLAIHGSRFDKSENRSVPLIFASADGGVSWRFLAEIQLKPELPMGIMPYPLILKSGQILMAVRRQYDVANAYTDIYASDDGGRDWYYLSRANDWGAPANLTELNDGRLVCTYGFRQHPWGIRATVSHDSGRSWTEEIILREDGGSPDLGYPRTLLLPDGKLITIYYFNTCNDPVQQCGGLRHIAATIWDVKAETVLNRT